jgi:hypothetical protein
MPSTNAQTNFEDLIKLLAAAAHGVEKFSEVRALLQGFSKTQMRVDFLSEYLSQNQILWESVKDHVWPTADLQEKNRYHFIQGDIIGSNLVRSVGSALSGTNHQLWLIVSPDCDCVRANYVKVAPVYGVDKDDESYKENKNNWSLAFRLSSSKFFPLGNDIFENGFEGYYADLSEPYFLHLEDKESVIVHFSMPKEGWHLLNAFLKESETRADISEGEKIRTRQTLHAVPVDVPQA